jgi:hypothetical protein
MSCFLTLCIFTAPQAGRLVEEEVAIAGGGLRILIYGDDDRLHMLIPPDIRGSVMVEFAGRSVERPLARRRPALGH